MFKLLAICLFAVAITKWGQKVQADNGVNDLDDEEKRLLQTLGDAIDQGKRDGGDPCDDACADDDDDCYAACVCFSQCTEAINDEDYCEYYCSGGAGDKRKVDGQGYQDQSKRNTKMSKKAWVRFPRIPTPRIPTPRIPIPRIPIPRIPTPRIPIPRIPRPRIPIPRIPRPSRWWRG